MKCPVCHKCNVTAGHILGHSRSRAKRSASKLNGKLGGRPKKVLSPSVTSSVAT